MCWRCAKLLHCPVTHRKMRNAQSWYLDEEQIQNYVLHQTALLHTASLTAKITGKSRCAILCYQANISLLQIVLLIRSSQPVTHTIGLIYQSSTLQNYSNPANLSPTLQDSSTCHPHYRTHLLVTHATGLVYLSPTLQGSSTCHPHYRAHLLVTHTTGLIYLSPTLQGSSTCHPHYRAHLLVTHATEFIQSSQTVTHTTGLFYLSPTLQGSSTCHPHYRTHLLVTHATGLIYLSSTPQGSSNPAKLSPTLQDSSTCHPHNKTHLLVTHTAGFIQSSQPVTDDTRFGR